MYNYRDYQIHIVVDIEDWYNIYLYKNGKYIEVTDKDFRSKSEIVAKALAEEKVDNIILAGSMLEEKDIEKIGQQHIFNWLSV